MYLRCRSQDADVCAMTVADGQLVIDAGISNPAMSCPAWLPGNSTLKQSSRSSGRTGRPFVTFPQLGPLPLCADDATDRTACCTPGSATNPGYDDAENPGRACPYFPSDNLSADEVPNLLETHPLSKEQDSHFRSTVPPEGVEPGR